MSVDGRTTSRPPKRLTIGQLARGAGVSVETVRFYQRRGLLEVPLRELGRTRAYPTEALRELRFIRLCAGLGFSLNDVLSLVRIRRERRGNCDAFHTKLDELDAELERQRREVEVRRQALAEIRALCEGGRRLADCHALAEVERKSQP